MLPPNASKIFQFMNTVYHNFIYNEIQNYKKIEIQIELINDKLWSLTKIHSIKAN